MKEFVLIIGLLLFCVFGVVFVLANSVGSFEEGCMAAKYHQSYMARGSRQAAWVKAWPTYQLGVGWCEPQ